MSVVIIDTKKVDGFNLLCFLLNCFM